MTTTYPFLGQTRFAYGTISANMHVATYSPSGFLPEEILTRLLPDNDVKTKASPPEWLLDAYKRSRAHWEEKARQGLIRNDTAMLVVRGVETVSGVRASELRKGYRTCLDPRLLLTFSLGWYIDHRSASTIFQDLEPQTKASILGLPPVNTGEIVQPHPFFSNSFGIILGVITADDKFIFATRSEKVAVNAGGIVVGVVEGCDEHDIIESSGLPDLYHAAARGLLEELGIEMKEESFGKELRLTSIALNINLGEWNCLGYARIGVTSQELLHKKGPDSWEFSKIAFIDFTPSAVATFLKENAAKMVSYGTTAAVLCLLSCFDAVEVLEACT